MTVLMLTTALNGRQLQRTITALLRQWVATAIQRINYVKNYAIIDWKLSRTEQKIVFIRTTDDKKEKLLQFLHKQGETDMMWLETIPVGEIG
jgi:uncharacterized protein involved in tolerance to divalent cations